VKYAGGPRMFTAVKTWLSELKWGPGQVANAELAIDFEVFSGLDLRGRGYRGLDAAPLNDRAAEMWRILRGMMTSRCEAGCNLAEISWWRSHGRSQWQARAVHGDYECTRAANSSHQARSGRQVLGP